MVTQADLPQLTLKKWHVHSWAILSQSLMPQNNQVWVDGSQGISEIIYPGKNLCGKVVLVIPEVTVQKQNTGELYSVRVSLWKNCRWLRQGLIPSRWNSAVEHGGKDHQCLSEPRLTVKSSLTACSNHFRKHTFCLRWHPTLCLRIYPWDKTQRKYDFDFVYWWRLKKNFSTRPSDILGGLCSIIEVASWNAFY